MLQDVRHAWKSLRATPRLTLAATACAALGLGAAIFMTTLVDAVLFATPPMPDADRLVRVWTSATGSRETADLSYPEVVDLQAHASSFEAVEAASRTRLAVTTAAGTERVRGESVTPGYFRMIGIQPALGRLFTEAEYAPDADRPVVISFDLWQRRFGGTPDVLGQLFRTRPTSRQAPEVARVIVGVMPRSFVGTVDPDVSDFWIPIAHYEPAPLLTDRLVRSTWMLGKLREGSTLEASRAEVTAIAARLALEHPAAYDNLTLVVEPFGESWRDRFRLSLLILLGAAGLLLLIACTNIASLLLARLAERERELRVRLALGAQRARLVRQLLIESLTIACVGGVVGLTVAAFAVRAFATAGVFALPPYVQIGLEPRTALAGMVLVVVTGLLFGVLPAFLGAGAEPAAVGRDAGTRVSLGRRQRRSGRVLVVAQLAFTCVLLIAATLLFRTYQQLLGDDLGYRTTGLLRMALTPDPNEYGSSDARLALADRIKAAFDAYPGVERSSVMAGVLPPWFDGAVDVHIADDVRLREVGRHAVGPDFLEVMDIRLQRGRTFEVADRSSEASTALISAALAQRVSDATGRDAVGQRIRADRFGAAAVESFDIIGVVNDVVYNGPLRPRAANHDVYVPLERGGSGALSIAIHASIDPSSLIEPLSRALGELAPSSPQHWVSTMDGELRLQYRDAELYAALSGVYGVAAAVLAMLGIYSVLANAVARRHRELGVRMAVGARAVDIIRLVLFEGARTLAWGVALGVVLAVFGARLLSGLLYGIAPNDPSTYVLVALGLIAAGLVACLVPSLRAARVDPVRALRAP